MKTHVYRQLLLDAGLRETIRIRGVDHALYENQLPLRVREPGLIEGDLAADVLVARCPDCAVPTRMKAKSPRPPIFQRTYVCACGSEFGIDRPTAS